MASLWRPDPETKRTLRMESMQKLYRAATKQGFSVHTKRSSFASNYVAEVQEHVDTGRAIDGVPVMGSFGRGAMHGETPIIAEVRALSMVGVRFQWHLIADELAMELSALLPPSVVMRELERAIDDLVETLRAR